MFAVVLYWASIAARISPGSNIIRKWVEPEHHIQRTVVRNAMIDQPVGTRTAGGRGLLGSLWSWHSGAEAGALRVVVVVGQEGRSNHHRNFLSRMERTWWCHEQMETWRGFSVPPNHAVNARDRRGQRPEESQTARVQGHVWLPSICMHACSSCVARNLTIWEGLGRL